MLWALLHSMLVDREREDLPEVSDRVAHRVRSFVPGDHQNTSASRCAERLRTDRASPRGPLDDLVDERGRDRAGERSLMAPFFTDQLCQRIEVTASKRDRHILGGFAHPLERAQYVWLSRRVRAEQRVSRLAGDPAISCIDDQTASLDLFPEVGIERDSGYV